jgi:hypothetical protein
MSVTYHVPESECRKVTERRSYSGHSWDALLKSAAITADAFGRAFIVCESGIPERHAGGHIIVSNSRQTGYAYGPTVLLAEVVS